MNSVPRLLSFFALLIVCAFASSSSLLRAEEGGPAFGTIGARPRAATPEQLKQIVRKLSEAPQALNAPVPRNAKNSKAVPADGGIEFHKSDAAEKLAEEARGDIDAWLRLLIPPRFPQAVPGADAGVRQRAAWVLGLARNRRALQRLVDSSVYDPDDGVRAAAASALPLLEEPVALRKLADLACAADYRKYPWPVRRNAARALVRYGDPEAVERLLRELGYELAGGSPYDSKNRLRGVAKGLGTSNPMMLPDGPPDLHLSEEDMYPVLSALKIVTGKSFDSGEKDMKTWLAWWRKAGRTFSFPKLKADR